MKIIIATLVVMMSSAIGHAENFNSISLEGQINSTLPVSHVQVEVFSDGEVVSTASEINPLVPDSAGYFSTMTYIAKPWVFRAGSNYTMRLSTGGFTISTFSITAMPFALTVRGDSPTGDQNIFGAYGNVGIGTANPLYRLVISSSAGSSSTILAISTGTSNVIRMTGAGEVFASKYYGDGSGLSGISGDNLGDHTATTILQMSGNQIIGVSSITATGHISMSRYLINGTTVLSLVGVGSSSLSIGPGTQSLNSDGSNNIAIGHYAGRYITTGFSNTLIGYLAGDRLSAGNGNVALGQNAGTGIEAGASNTYIGLHAGHSSFQHTRNNESCVGAFTCNNTGGGNSVLGYQAGMQTTGSNNVFIGYNAGENSTSGDGNIVLGASQNVSAVDSSRELNIGGVLFGNLQSKLIGISIRAPQAALDVLSTGTLANQHVQIWRNSAGAIVSSLSATGVMMAGKFVGDGSGLMGIPSGADSLGNHLATTTLNLAGNQILGVSSITISGSAFSVGVSTFVVSSGSVGIGKTNPSARLDVSGGISASGDIVSSGTIRGNIIGSVIGNATTATAFSANPGNCPSGQVAGGISESGVAESCVTPATLSGNQVFSGENTFNSSTTLNGSIYGNGTINDRAAVYFDTSGYAFTQNAQCVATTVTLTTDNVPVTIQFTGGVMSLQNFGWATIGVRIDGKDMSSIDPSAKRWVTGAQSNAAGNVYIPAGFTYTTLNRLSAGSHNFCIYLLGSSGVDFGLHCKDEGGADGTYDRGTDGCRLMVMEAR